jgi:hypothetical protein
VDLREFFLENFAGDLEYHPRRAVLYLALAVGAACFWTFSAAEDKFTAVPLVFALGSLTLLGKGIYLLRPSSEGFGVSDAEVVAARKKALPSIREQAAQVVQDFGTGGLLLWPLLNIGKDIDAAWVNPPRWLVFGIGALLFGVGWAIRRFTRGERAPVQQ